VEFSFGSRGQTAGRLVAEFTGRTSNLLHLSPAAHILAILRPVRKADRLLRPGAAYQPPPVPPSSAPGSAPERFPQEQGRHAALCAAIDRFYAPLEQAERVRSLRNALAARLNAERKRIEKLLANIEADARPAENLERLRLCGELLKLHLHDVPHRATLLTVPNVYDPSGAAIAIPLLAALSPHQNMERYFRRCKRLLAAREQAAGRVADARRRLAQISAAAIAVQEAETIEQLDAVAAGTLPAGPKANARPAGPRRFVSADGLEILVGRNRAENDEITFHLAKGNDLWMHVEAYTGSHVLVRLPKGKPVPQETLLDAATLAIHFSQLRDAAGGPAVYCPRQHVTKPRGAKPGQVLYTQSRTLHVTVERSRLDRLLQREG